MLPLCEELGVGFVPYFPLASGLLTGKYRRGEPAPAGTRLAGREIDDDTFDRVEAARARSRRSAAHTLLELAIGALASQPAVVSVIAGATTPEQVRANAAAARGEAEELADPLEAREAVDVLVELAGHRHADRRADLRDRGSGTPRSSPARSPRSKRALERGLRGLARGELDVGGGEVLRPFGELVEVDVGIGDLRDVAAPDAGARRAVRRADGQQVVEAARPRERVVELADRVRGADEQPRVGLAEERDQLQQLVRDRARLRLRLAARRDLLDLVDEDDDAVEVEQLVEELAQRAGAAVRVAADELAREDLDERPAEPSGDRLRERRLARAGRAEQDDRRRGDDAVAASPPRARRAAGSRGARSDPSRAPCRRSTPRARPGATARRAPRRGLPTPSSGGAAARGRGRPRAGRSRRRARCRPPRSSRARASRCRGRRARAGAARARAGARRRCRAGATRARPTSAAPRPAARRRAPRSLPRPVADQRDERRLARGDRAEHVGEREGERRAGGVVLPEMNRGLELRVVEVADDELGGVERDGLGQRLHRETIPPSVSRLLSPRDSRADT